MDIEEFESKVQVIFAKAKCQEAEQWFELKYTSKWKSKYIYLTPLVEAGQSEIRRVSLVGASETWEACFYQAIETIQQVVHEGRKMTSISTDVDTALIELTEKMDAIKSNTSETVAYCMGINSKVGRSSLAET